jgi:hypothetical protein
VGGIRFRLFFNRADQNDRAASRVDSILRRNQHLISRIRRSDAPAAPTAPEEYRKLFLLRIVDTQRDNLYAGTANIVQVRTDIAALLRSLLVSTATADDVNAQVLALSETYGSLDGENNYCYASAFAQTYQSLSDDQKTKLAGLRQDIMSGEYDDSTLFDFTTCNTYFLYSDEISDASVLDAYIGDTDYLFFEP